MILILLGVISLHAYSQTLKGHLCDVQKKPVEGAYIYFPSKGIHTHTDLNGNFAIDGISNADTMIISHMSFETIQMPVNLLSNEMLITLKDKMLSLEEVKISPQVNALSIFADIDIQSNPVNSSQEILRKVPGLIIGQHAGGGKAEQIFLRGFDNDHGTDINISVDGIPVNMVSHAHGQGYADLHFLIPETIDKIDFGKGPYYASKGNFTTTGYVAFKTKEALEHSEVKIDAGSFNTSRLLGMFDLMNNEKQSAYLASEFLLTDGPFESPQNFSRINLMGKYSRYFENRDKLSLLFSMLRSRWDASGQIPQRAVDSGLISRFGAIDNTEGGYTGRSNLLMQHRKFIDSKTWVNSSVYYSSYYFELYSNFTLFLNDSINGDEIRQKEDRKLFGMQSEWNHKIEENTTNGLLQAAIGFRNDEVNGDELSHTVDRKTTLKTIMLGDVAETNYFAYLNVELNFGKWLINPSLRYDRFEFTYADFLSTTYTNQSLSKSCISPKLNVLYNSSDQLQFYFKSGKGFHSNDTRVILAQSGEEILPAAYGTDLGAMWKPTSKILINAALWQLFLQQEFVYVGDEAVVEPSGPSQRAGVDFGFRIQIAQSIFMNNDLNYAYARSIDEPVGENYIPLAPDLTMMGGISYLPAKGFYASLKYRMIKNRPANENNSIVAKGYTIIDTNAGYRWKKLNFGLLIENLLNSDWNETQFATETRLANETQSVEEICFTPGTPISIKASLSYKF